MARYRQEPAHSCKRHQHNHDHSHGHHGHNHAVSGEKNLLLSIALNTVITAAEIVGGIVSGSLALLSDAFHNFSDVVSMIISYIAILVGKKAKDEAKTYGYKRAEILAALFNVLALFGACIYIIYEAIKRFSNPEPIQTGLMLVIAFIGLAANGLSVLLLFRNAKENINIRSAFLHLLGDTVSSVAVIIVAIALMFKPWYILDTIASILIALYIIKEGFSILMESVNILMQGSPVGIDPSEIISKLRKIRGAGIRDVHHVHIWEITPGNAVFDAHVIVDKKGLKNADRIIKKINMVLRQNFPIRHSTIQLESGTNTHCETCEL